MAPPDAGGRKTRSNPKSRAEDRHRGADAGSRGVSPVSRRRGRGGCTRSGAQAGRPAHRIRGRCWRREFDRRLARAMARAAEIEVECGADDLAPDHRRSRKAATGLACSCGWSPDRSSDAAAAAKICAALIENERPCATTVFDGQRLADERRRAGGGRQSHESQACRRQTSVRPNPPRTGAAPQSGWRTNEPAKKPDPPSTLSSFFGRHRSP